MINKAITAAACALAIATGATIASAQTTQQLTPRAATTPDSPAMDNVKDWSGAGAPGVEKTTEAKGGPKAPVSDGLPVVNPSPNRPTAEATGGNPNKGPAGRTPDQAQPNSFAVQ
ncbi:MAG: hypothetical protein KDJ37_13170 [Hyphomicrobiaceae bacterium]|nr:hypothetical protein [Hyphomicrobiaceae bacterium]